MKRTQKTDLIVIHCSATGPATDIGAAEIDRWHKDRGWKAIGYHLVIRRNGLVEPGRPLGDVGAHSKGHNMHSVGVCMVGGVNGTSGKPEMNFTETQFETLPLVVDFLSRMYPGATVLGHRDLSPDIDGDGIIEKHEWVKECPCFDVASFFSGRRAT